MSLAPLAFFIFFIGGSLVSLVRGPLWGLLVYVGVFYVHPPSRWWGDEIPELRWSLYSAIIVLLSTVAHMKDIVPKSPWLSHTPAKLLLAYALWMWVQSLWAIDFDDHIEGSILFTKYVILFYLIYTVIDSKEKLQIFSLAHVVGCCYLGWHAFQAGGGKLDGVGGPGIDEANRLGTHLGTGIMYAAMFVLAAEQRIKTITFFLIPLILNGIILTLSRGAFLGLLAGGVGLWRMKPKSASRRFKLYAGLGVVLFALLAHQQFWDRLATLTADDSERDSSASSRVIFLQAEWELSKDYPLGGGHRAFQHMSPIYLAPYVAANPMMGAIKGNRSSHNMYMAILSEQGVPGLIIYFGLLIWVWKTTVMLRRLEVEKLPDYFAMYTAAFSGALLVVAVAAMFSNYFRAEIQIWALASLLVAKSLATQYLVDKKRQCGIRDEPLATRSFAGGPSSDPRNLSR